MPTLYKNNPRFSIHLCLSVVSKCYNIVNCNRLQTVCFLKSYWDIKLSRLQNMSTIKEITYQFSVHFCLDVPSKGKEGIFYVDASLSTRFHELYPMFYCQLQRTSKIISISSFLSRIKLVNIKSNIINYIHSKVV